MTYGELKTLYNQEKAEHEMEKNAHSMTAEICDHQKREISDLKDTIERLIASVDSLTHTVEMMEVNETRRLETQGLEKFIS